MENEILKYVSKFDALSPEEVQAVAANILVQTFKKGTVLLREGEIATKCYFILKGCIRQYTIVEGVEKTTAFYTEEQAAVSFTSYSQQVPCSHYFSCVEDSTVIVGDPRTELEMYQKFPVLESITRGVMEQGFGQAQEDFASFVTSSPEDRYQKLLSARPDLLKRVPQHQIASFLGMTPESLSRIRKRIATKK